MPVFFQPAYFRVLGWHKCCSPTSLIKLFSGGVWTLVQFLLLWLRLVANSTYLPLFGWKSFFAAPTWCYHYLIDWLLQDEDPYVRKTAAVSVAKLHDINSSLVEEQGFLDSLKVRNYFMTQGLLRIIYFQISVKWVKFRFRFRSDSEVESGWPIRKATIRTFILYTIKANYCN